MERVVAEQVTVVIPTRNRLPLLRESVASVRDQTARDWRLVIVDDASEDGTSDWIEDLHDERIRSIPLQMRSERSAARNRGLVECETPYVLFLDDDDVLRPTALNSLASALRGSSTAVASIGGCVYFDEEGHEYALPHPQHRCERSVWMESVFGWVGNNGRTLFRASAVRDAGGFSEDLVMGEDRDLWLRISRLGPAILIPDVVARYRVHADQWRPADVETLEEAITERSLVRLAPRQRQIGDRIVDFRRSYDRAYTALNASRHREALVLFASMRRAPASLVFSPLVRRSILFGSIRAFIGTLLGARGIQVVRSLRARARRGRANDDPWTVPSWRTVETTLSEDANGRGPTVTIVIPTRNRLSLLTQAVESIRSQTFEQLELIVVDDASSDDTWNWLSTSPSVRAFRLDVHSERCRARNLGLREAKGEFVLFLDDDDRLTPTALTHLVAALRRYKDTAAAVGAYVMYDESGNRARASHPRARRRCNAWPDVVFGWVANPSRTLFRTDSVRSLGGFKEDLDFAEDRELCLRLTRTSAIALVPDVVLEYRLHAGQRQPSDGLSAVDTVIEAHAADLRPQERAVFSRVRAARAMQRAGIQALDDLDHRAAVRKLAAAIRAQPSLARSPLTRRELVQPLAKALLFLLMGKRAVVGMRRLIAAVRRRAGRDVWASRAPLGDRPVREGKPR